MNKEKQRQRKIRSLAHKFGMHSYRTCGPFIISTIQIGTGSKAEVFKGADLRSENLVAVKKMSVTQFKDSKIYYQNLKKKQDIMKTINHQNIVKLYDIKMTENSIYLFLELCDKGSLQTVLEKRKKFPEAQALVIMKQIINAYKHLHEKCIVHRNIQPNNILIHGQTYKLSDFKFLKQYKEGTQNNAMLESGGGNLLYISPEKLEGYKYSTKSDVWSMGAMFYKMLYGKSVGQEKSIDQQKRNISSKIIKFPQLSTSGLKSLLQKMLKFDPEQRISWKEIFDLQIFVKKAHDFNSSLALAKINAFDELSISQKMNEIYFEDKKVIQQIQFTNNMDLKESLVGSYKSSESAEDCFQQIAYKYNQRQNELIMVSQVKNWVLERRNMIVYLNILSLKINKCFELKKLNIPIQQAVIFRFVISKWAYMMIIKILKQYQQKKIMGNAFTQKQYQIFLKYQASENIKEMIKNDFKTIGMLADQLTKQVQSYLTQQESKLPKNFKKIKSFFNNNENKALFAQIYFQTIDELQKVCKQAFQTDPKCRQVIQLRYYVGHAMKLKKNELGTKDFSKIFDNCQKMRNEDLIKEINENIFLYASMI